MAEPDLLEREYLARADRYGRLAQEAEYAIGERLNKAGIKTHLVTSRVKTLESIRAKAERKALEAPLEELHDLVGVRVVVLFQSDLPRVLELVQDVFAVETVDDKIEGGDTQEFGYMSIHASCKLSESYGGARYDDLKELRFEVQLRTIVMDAWANVSHYLDYKGASSVPSTLRRDFYALSGLFYVADQHFELFFRGAEESRAHAQEEAAAGTDADVEINLDTVTALFQRMYPNRRHSRGSVVSEFIEELNVVGFTNVGELEAALRRAMSAAEAYEAEHPPSTRSQRYADVGIARAALSIAFPAHARARSRQPSRYKKYRSLVSG